jgi:hypothetical protein
MNLKYPKYHFLRVLLSFIVFLFFTLHWDWGIYSIIVEITLNFLYFCFYIYLAFTILLLLFSFLESLMKSPLNLLNKLTFLLLIYLFWIIWIQFQDYVTFPTGFEIVFGGIILMLFGVIFFANPAFLFAKRKNT